MRTIQTFVLRLLTNSDDPQGLRGVLQAVASGEEQPFKDGSALLALLKRMAAETPESQPIPGCKQKHKIKNEEK